MRVLISYTTDGQISIIKGLTSSLSSRGVDVLVWNRTTHNCFSNNDQLFKENIRFFNSLKKYPRIALIVLYHIPRFLSILVKKGFKDIDILNYHFHEELCDRLVPYLNRNRIKLLVSIWGSDFYRISDQKKLYRQKIYPFVDHVHVETPAVKKDFLDVFNIPDNKVTACNFGVSLFDNIDKLRNSKLEIKCELLPPIAKDKIVVSCGYNARKGQQHQLMINALKKLPQIYKERLFIVFPLTYSVPGDSFFDEIDNALSDFDIPYYCFKNLLQDDELAKLRLISDIVINVQITDSLSTSLVEYIFSGNIMLLAEWLPYGFLTEDYGIKYIPITSNNIDTNLRNVLDHYEEEAKESNLNIERVRQLASWDSVSSRFFEMFSNI